MSRSLRDNILDRAGGRLISFIKYINTATNVEKMRNVLTKIYSHLEVVPKKSEFIINEYIRELSIGEDLDLDLSVFASLVLKKHKEYSFEELKFLSVMLYSEEVFQTFISYRFDFLKVSLEMANASLPSLMYNMKEDHNNRTFNIEFNSIKMKIKLSTHFKNERSFQRKYSVYNAVNHLGLIISKNAQIHLKVNKMYGIYNRDTQFESELIIFVVDSVSYSNIEVTIITAIQERNTGNELSAKNLDGVFVSLHHPISVLYIDSKYLTKDKEYVLSNGQFHFNDIGKNKYSRILTSERMYAFDLDKRTDMKDTRYYISDIVK